MNAIAELKSDVEYGRKILNSGLAGARAAQAEFLHGEPVTPYLRESVREAWVPALVGAILGAVSSYEHDRSARKAFAWSLLGAGLGFGVGFAWGSRRLTASVATGAWNKIGRTRDEHWLEHHPIDYA
jgi:hypothetical protein